MSAFVSCFQTDEHAILTFNTRRSFQLPESLLACDIPLFESVLSFASKLIETEKSIQTEYVRDQLFSEYLKDIEKKHSQQINTLEKLSVTETTTRLAPLVQKISDMEQAHTAAINDLKRDYDQQIRALQKEKKTLESDSTSIRTEVESVAQKEMKQLNKKIAELELDLARSSRAESIVREQCQAESDRLIKAIKESAKELVKVKEDALQQREEKLAKKEEELQVKIQRAASSAYRGQDGENWLSSMVKDKMNWDLKYTGDVPHSCDYSSTVHNVPVFFEHKNYTHSVPQKEVTKFLRDMKEHPEVLVGIFISQNTGIQGKPSTVPFSIDWIHGSQCVVYIQSIVEMDMDYALSLMDQIIRVSGAFNKVIKSQGESSSEKTHETRIEQAKLYLQNSLTRTNSLMRKVSADKKQLISIIETNTTQNLLDLKQQSAELSTGIQILLGEYTDSQEDSAESEEPVVLPTLPKEKAKRKPAKASSGI